MRFLPGSKSQQTTTTTVPAIRVDEALPGGVIQRAKTVGAPAGHGLARSIGEAGH
ncbi:MAG: hypothetical protein ACTHOP_11700 [Mesorhizobium sp.]|jgi:hypothetical protein